MKTYRVIIKETLTYSLEVKAENEEQAVDEAFNHHDYMNSITDECESEVEEVFEEED